MSSLLGLFLFLCFAAASSRADTFQSFSFNATLTDSGISSGTLTLDETTGLFTGANLSMSFLMPRPQVPSNYIFSMVESQGVFGAPSSDDPGREFFDLELDEPDLSNPNEPFVLDLVLPGTNLVGYGGGSVCSEAFNCSFALQEPSGFNVFGQFAPSLLITR